MRWRRGHKSEHVIDERDEGPAVGGLGGRAIVPLFHLASRFGWKGILVLLLGLGLWWFFSARAPQVARVGADGAAPESDPAVEFVGFVLDDVQATWQAMLGERYRPADLVLFSGATRTACGFGSSATGPFYCPLDERVYLDLSFFDELARRFGAPGDFAAAYVIAHEVGHHVQHLLGATERAQGAGATGASGGSVRLELQADCYAGVWAFATSRRDLLEAGDVEEALGAASAIGDDRLQRQQEGTVNPDTFTHGTAEQRVRWFRRGYESGDRAACDTFGASTL